MSIGDKHTDAQPMRAPDGSHEENPQPTDAERAAPGFSYERWYEQNKDRFNKGRRTRYQSDPKYREKVLAWNRQSREKKRKVVELEKREEAKARKVALPEKRWKRFLVSAPDGSATEYYTIGALAAVLNRSIQVIRLWEAQGVIPQTPHTNEKGDRLYTKDQIQSIYELLTQQNRLNDQGKRRGQGMNPFYRKVKWADGDESVVALYKVGVLAKAINRTIVTIEQMEAREALPVTPFRGGGTKYRLYTVEMIKAVRDAFAARGWDIRGEDKRRAFYEEVRRAWTDLGVLGATMTDEEVQPPADSDDGGDGE